MKLMMQKDLSNEQLASVRELYQESFPIYEQRSWDAHLQAANDPHFYTNTYWEEDGQLSGLLFYWQEDSLFYIEHLAVSPQLRNGKRGKKILESFLAPSGLYILEIDPPEDDISIRRLHFYERLGFIHNLYPYLHLSYSRKRKPHRLHIMSYGRAISEEEFHFFEDFMRRRPMRYLGD